MKWYATSCLLAALASIPTPARAANVLIQQLQDHYDDVKVTSFAFGTNQAPSRAWVTLDVYRENGHVDIPEIDPYSVVRSWVPGLSRVGDQILFTSGSRVTVCATVVHKRFLWVRYDRVEKTGRCDIKTEHGQRRRDDGFEVTTIPVINVYFQVQE
jgi:hypothetical protein